jgi:hypothetical protein
MSDAEAVQPIGEDEAREAVNRWSAGGFFRVRNFGDKIFVQAIRAWASYNLGLRTHYEERAVRQVRRPFSGGPVDDRGRPPGAWEVSVRRPHEFEQRDEVLPIPHTERVQRCPACAGEGAVSCDACQGSGWVPCPRCLGAGYIDRPEMTAGGDGSGGPGVRTVRVACACQSGRARCPACAGNGRRTCRTCDGSGQVKTFDQVTVRFLSSVKSDVLDRTPVPDKLIARLGGDVVLDEKAPQIERVRAVAPEVDGHVESLLTASRQIDEANARILLQHLHVERVPVFEVDYTYAGVGRQLWVCGKERSVYAPKAPWHRGRLAALVAGLVLAAVAVAAALWLFWPR